MRPRPCPSLRARSHADPVARAALTTRATVARPERRSASSISVASTAGSRARRSSSRRPIGSPLRGGTRTALSGGARPSAGISGTRSSARRSGARRAATCAAPGSGTSGPSLLLKPLRSLDTGPLASPSVPTRSLLADFPLSASDKPPSIGFPRTIPTFGCSSPGLACNSAVAPHRSSTIARERDQRARKCATRDPQRLSLITSSRSAPPPGALVFSLWPSLPVLEASLNAPYLAR